MLVLAAAVAVAGCSAGAPEEVVTRSSVTDPAGDVVVGGLGEDRESVDAAPRNTITDIVATTIDHGTDAITIDVAFEDLRPRQYLDLTADVATDGTASGRPTQVTALTYLGESSIDVYHGDETSTCVDAEVVVDDDLDRVTVSVPRACLDDPRWIEAEVRAATMRYRATGPRADAVWEDDAYATGLTEWSDRGTSVRLHHP